MKAQAVLFGALFVAGCVGALGVVLAIGVGSVLATPPPPELALIYPAFMGFVLSIAIVVTLASGWLGAGTGLYVGHVGAALMAALIAVDADAGMPWALLGIAAVELCGFGAVTAARAIRRR